MWEWADALGCGEAQAVCACLVCARRFPVAVATLECRAATRAKALRDALEYQWDHTWGQVAAEVSQSPEALYQLLKGVHWDPDALVHWWPNYGKGRVRFCHGPDWYKKLLQCPPESGSGGSGASRLPATLEEQRAWGVKDRLRKLQAMGPSLAAMQRNPSAPQLQASPQGPPTKNG